MRGSVLLVVIFMVGVLGSIVLVMLEEPLSEKRSLETYETGMRALEIAEAGIAMAEIELGSDQDPDGDGSGTLSGSYAGGTFEVTATLDDPATKRYVLRAEGRYGLGVRRLEVGVKKRQSSLFKMAMFAKDDLDMTGGSWTDAYDSRLGTYASQVVSSDAVGPYAQGGASVGSNANIVVGGGGIVRGDAQPGPFGVTTLSGGSTAWGTTAPRAQEEVIPDPPFADFLAAYAANDNLAIDVSNPKVSYTPSTMWLNAGGGAPITLSGGTYIFNTLLMTGGGTLYITGPCKIYITNRFEISGGGIANMTGRPENCQIIAHAYDFPPGSKHDKMFVKTSGGSQTALAVFAPTFHYETSGGGELYGAVIANTIVFSGAAGFHYDQALGDLGGGGSGKGVERLYWVDRTVNP